MPFSSIIKVVSKSSLTLTNVESQDELILVGLENVLNDVTVTVSNPHFMYVGRPYNKGDTRAWPIGLKSVFWTEGKPGMNEQFFFLGRLAAGRDLRLRLRPERIGCSMKSAFFTKMEFEFSY